MIKADGLSVNIQKALIAILYDGAFAPSFFCLKYKGAFVVFAGSQKLLPHKFFFVRLRAVLSLPIVPDNYEL